MCEGVYEAVKQILRAEEINSSHEVTFFDGSACHCFDIAASAECLQLHSHPFPGFPGTRVQMTVQMQTRGAAHNKRGAGCSRSEARTMHLAASSGEHHKAHCAIAAARQRRQPL
jgi:hypothetical protein